MPSPNLVLPNAAIAGFDPGKDKCGLAVARADGSICYHEIVASDRVASAISDLLQQFPIAIFAIGDRTTSKTWQQQLAALLPPAIEIVRVDERNTTLEARDRYWQMYPPRGLARLIPQGMRLPPREVDDIAAILLIERYLRAIEN